MLVTVEIKGKASLPANLYSWNCVYFTTVEIGNSKLVQVAVKGWEFTSIYWLQNSSPYLES